MGNETSQPSGNSDGSPKSAPGFNKAYHRARTSSGDNRMMTEEETLMVSRRVEDILYNFRARAGTDLVCSQLYSTWQLEENKIKDAWNGLTLPARRAMVQHIREQVIWRGRSLHRLLLNPGQSSKKDRTRFVRLLLEKVCAEIFDTGVLYNGESLLVLVGDVLKNGGGGPQLPKLVKSDIQRSFDVEEHFRRAREGTGYPKHSNSDPDLRKLLRRQTSSTCMVDILSFLPKEMKLETRKSLTLRMVNEMRNAILAHFAVLVFGELIDDTEKVIRKYEYGSDSETDIGTDCTEWEDEVDEDVSSSSEGVSDTDSDLQSSRPILRRSESCSLDETTSDAHPLSFAKGSPKSSKLDVSSKLDFKPFSLKPPPHASSAKGIAVGSVERLSPKKSVKSTIGAKDNGIDRASDSVLINEEKHTAIETVYPSVPALVS